jgi:hypothetical protein
MPRSKKPGWVNWQSSSARAIISEDLLPGGPLFQLDNVPAAAILEWYKDKHPNQFDGIIREPFAARLKDHRKQGLEEYAMAQEEEEYFTHDRKLKPSQARPGRACACNLACLYLPRYLPVSLAVTIDL